MTQRSEALPDIPRGADERVLTALHLNAGGMQRKKIAAAMGLRPENVAAMIDHIRTADLAESGEPAAEVAGHYP